MPGAVEPLAAAWLDLIVGPEVLVRECACEAGYSADNTSQTQEIQSTSDVVLRLCGKPTTQLKMMTPANALSAVQTGQRQTSHDRGTKI